MGFVSLVHLRINLGLQCLRLITREDEFQLVHRVVRIVLVVGFPNVGMESHADG